MKLLMDWGFNQESWKGQRGEYWVLVQLVLIGGYILLPVYRPSGWVLPPPLLYLVGALALGLGGLAMVLVAKGLLDLGRNLTPLPYPRQDGELIQSGIYGVVRHPLYGGLILAAAAWAIGQVSLSHAIATLILMVFFNLKANQEEKWLQDRYPDYVAYRQSVKKLIPWVF